MKFGEYIRFCRTRRMNLTIGDVADHMGVTVLYFSQLERGLVAPPDTIVCIEFYDKLSKFIYASYVHLIILASRYHFKDGISDKTNLPLQQLMLDLSGHAEIGLLTDAHVAYLSAEVKRILNILPENQDGG